MMQAKGGLGRGLSALLPPESTSGLREIALEDITPNPRQPRTQFDPEAVDELAASIRAVGVLQPIVVRRTGDGYQLIVGERRWRAARLAGLDTIPAIVRETGDEEMLRDALIENVQRQDLNPLEEAAAYRGLIDEGGLTHDDVAAQVGKSRAAVTNALRLLNLAPGVQQRLASGLLSAAHGRAIAALADHASQERAAARVVAESLSVRATEDLVRNLAAAGTSLAPRASKTRAGVAAHRPAGILEVEKRLSDILETRVRIETRGRRGRIEVEFADMEDLDRTWKLLARD
ncbi:MAG: ParB/RepB/Spo0J family partition protein [Actinomycetota bacterium]